MLSSFRRLCTTGFSFKARNRNCFPTLSIPLKASQLRRWLEATTSTLWTSLNYLAVSPHNFGRGPWLLVSLRWSRQNQAIRSLSCTLELTLCLFHVSRDLLHERHLAIWMPWITGSGPRLSRKNQSFFLFLCTSSSTIRIAFRILPSSRSGDIALHRCLVVGPKIYEHPPHCSLICLIWW